MVEGGTAGPRHRWSKAQQAKESTAGLERPFWITAERVYQSVVCESVSPIRQLNELVPPMSPLHLSLLQL